VVLGSNSHFENSLGHQPPETAKKDKIAIVFLKKYVTFVSYIVLGDSSLFPGTRKIAVPIHNFSIRGIRKFMSFVLKSRISRMAE